MPALGELAWLSASPRSRFASPMPNQRVARHQRETLQIAIKPRLVVREPYGVRTEALLRLSRRAELASDRVLRKFLPSNAQ